MNCPKCTEPTLLNFASTNENRLYFCSNCLHEMVLPRVKDFVEYTDNYLEAFNQQQELIRKINNA